MHSINIFSVEVPSFEWGYLLVVAQLPFRWVRWHLKLDLKLDWDFEFHYLKLVLAFILNTYIVILEVPSKFLFVIVVVCRAVLDDEPPVGGIGLV